MIATGSAGLASAAWASVARKRRLARLQQRDQHRREICLVLAVLLEALEPLTVEAAPGMPAPKQANISHTPPRTNGARARSSAARIAPNPA